jgi:hypothetical protein
MQNRLPPCSTTYCSSSPTITLAHRCCFSLNLRLESPNPVNGVCPLGSDGMSAELLSRSMPPCHWPDLTIWGTSLKVYVVSFTGPGALWDLGLFLMPPQAQQRPGRCLRNRTLGISIFPLCVHGGRFDCLVLCHWPNGDSFRKGNDASTGVRDQGGAWDVALGGLLGGRVI